jgi:hypothetical protein
MEELLVVIIQCLVEMVFYFPFDSLTTSWSGESEELGGCGLLFLYFVAGGTIGGFSLLILPRHLIHSSAVRVANLFIAPILAGTMAWGLMTWLKSSNIARLPRNHFWTAFWFVLGFDAIRLAWGSR